MSLLQRAIEKDKAIHDRITRKFPKSVRIIDAVFGTFLNIVSNPLFAIILALVLVPLVTSETISLINAISIGGAWVIAVAWLARSSPLKEFPVPSRFLVTMCLALILAVGGMALGRWSTKQWEAHHADSESKKQSIYTPPPSIALFAKCDMVGFPIEIPPQDAIRVIPVNEKGMKSVNWGSYEIRNNTKKIEQWPDKAKIQQSVRQHNLGMSAYRCEISNHASSNLFDVAMPMRFWFGNKAGEENAVKYIPIISPLDAGHSFVLYFVNDCPISATGILPIYATVLVAGETTRRTTKLNLPNRNPVDPIMAWFPTKIRWVGSTQCE